MSTKMKYLKDSNNKIFAPAVNQSSITNLNQYIINNKKLIWYSKSVNEQVYDKTIPRETIHLRDTNYGNILSDKWVCNKSGIYLIEVHTRINDKESTDTSTTSESAIMLYITDTSGNELSINDTTFARPEFWTYHPWRKVISGSYAVKLEPDYKVSIQTYSDYDHVYSNINAQWADLLIYNINIS